MEPPDRHLFRGHAELRVFDAVNPGSSMIWRRTWFDGDSGIGAGEYSFHNGGRATAAHGVAVVEIRDGRIAVWRKYQQRGAIDFQDFLEVEGKRWEWTRLAPSSTVHGRRRQPVSRFSAAAVGWIQRTSVRNDRLASVANGN